MNGQLQQRAARFAFCFAPLCFLCLFVAILPAAREDDYGRHFKVYDHLSVLRSNTDD